MGTGIYRVIERCKAFPNRTITFHQTRGPVIDLGAVLPGGALYLGDRELADIAKAVLRSPDGAFPRVLAQIRTSGWASPADVAAVRDALEQQLAAERAARELAEQQLAALHTAIELVPGMTVKEPGVGEAADAVSEVAPEPSAVEPPSPAADGTPLDLDPLNSIPAEPPPPKRTPAKAKSTTAKGGAQ